MQNLLDVIPWRKKLLNYISIHFNIVFLSHYYLLTDNDKEHTKENCQIVCLAIQHGKLTHDTNKVINYVESIRKNINLINAK